MIWSLLRCSQVKQSWFLSRENPWLSANGLTLLHSTRFGSLDLWKARSLPCKKEARLPCEAHDEMKPSMPALSNYWRRTLKNSFSWEYKAKTFRWSSSAVCFFMKLYGANEYKQLVFFRTLSCMCRANEATWETGSSVQRSSSSSRIGY